MKEKVIFDTNTLRNPEINKFLGNRKELELFVQDAEIIIPLTVVEEIKRQKRTKLKSNKDSFISNPFCKNSSKISFIRLRSLPSIESQLRQ